MAVASVRSLRNKMDKPLDSITVAQSLPLERLDVFLKTQLPQVSRGMLQSMIEDGDIVVNEKQVKPTYSPRAGDIITIHWPEPEPCRGVRIEPARGEIGARFCPLRPGELADEPLLRRLHDVVQ